MKVLNQHQIKEWDLATIDEQYQSSFELMGHAAKRLAERIYSKNIKGPFYIFCGSGNNGGDGLLVGKTLALFGKEVYTYLIIENGFTQDNISAQKETDFFVLNDENNLPIMKEGCIIDAIFGSGLNKPIKGFTANVIHWLNSQNAYKVSIDIPSGLFADEGSEGTIFKADITLSIQSPKKSFFFKETNKYTGNWEVVEIGLSKKYLQKINNEVMYFTLENATSVLKNRSPFDHKGTWGHAALCCGSEGMTGAAVLSAKSCLRSGVGKLTCYVPKCSLNILQITIPEAMCVPDKNEQYLSSSEINNNHDAIGIGCGIGTKNETAVWLFETIKNTKCPLVLDADALNLIADNNWVSHLKPDTIITPHPKEFDRLFGYHGSSIERYKTQLKISEELKIYIVLKGKYTCTTSPDGQSAFNSTGNEGMATAGSGDVLTGIITSLLAQGYSSKNACYLGTFIHGLAGDITADKLSIPSMIAGDIIDSLGDAYKHISKQDEIHLSI